MHQRERCILENNVLLIFQHWIRTGDLLHEKGQRCHSPCLAMHDDDQCDQIWRNFATLAKNKVFGHFWYGLISIVQTFLPNMAIFYATRQILIVENGQVLINNLAIWSH